MRFDTRDKKPHIGAMAGLAAAAAAAVAALAMTGGDRYALPICVVLDGFFLAAVALLVWAFFAQIGYNPYSYNTIYYAGFSLFLLSVLIALVTLTVQLSCEPDRYLGQELTQIAAVLFSSAEAYMLVSLPFVLALSAALCVSNAVLIRREGRRPVNVLGILLSLLLIGGELFLFLADGAVSGSEQYVRLHGLFTNCFAAVYLYFECMVIGIMIAAAIVSRYQPRPDKDVLIVLGCALRRDGTPTPLLRDRLDRAITFRREQLERTGKELVLITSGGQGPDEVLSESEAMKRYLVENGVPEHSILKEDRSTSTLENMAFSKAMIDERFPGARVAFATTNYHVFRSGLCARRVKLRAVGMGARSKWYFWPNALVREFVGLLTEHRGKQALILTGLIAVYAALALATI